MSAGSLTRAFRTLVERMDEGRVRFRALGALYLCAAPLTLASVVLPHRPGGELGVAALGALCVVFGTLLVALPDRLPQVVLPVLLAGGAVMVTLAVLFTSDAASPLVLFYVWVAVEAFFFLGGRRAVWLNGFIGVCYAAALVSVPGGGGDAIERWLMVVGACSVSSVLAGVLNARAEHLIDELSYAARTDALTGLLNRRGFEEVMASELERARRGGHMVSVVIGDLDHFKVLNDRFGHQSGDCALQELALLCNEARRSIDAVARIGGEEFALVLPHTDGHGAYIVAERLRRAIRTNTAHATLRASFGVATFPEHGVSANALLKAADQALYLAKQLGRDRSVIYSPEVAATVQHGLDVPVAAHEQTTAVIVLAETLDLRDAGTAMHSQTVGRYAETIATQLGLEPERVERLRLAGLLHDIGKLGVPDEILRKPDRLTEAEFAEIRKHPELGARILAGANLEDISGWVLAHHERPDGRGYPYGLQGEQVALEARILSVADSFEAMTSDRVYRRALPLSDAIAELERCSGEQFDAAVVQAFLATLRTRVAA